MKSEKSIYNLCLKNTLVFFLTLFFTYILGFIIYNSFNNYGSVKRGSDISVTNDLFKLNEEEVFSLGSNRPECPEERGACWIYNMPIKETPSEIYNIERDTHKMVHLPNNILYQPYGILLDKDKLLLTNVSKSKIIPKDNIGVKGTDFSIYKTMAVIDLKTNKIIQTFDKKINKQYEPNQQHTTYTLLNNGKVLIIDFENQIAEVYCPCLNNSYTINFHNNNQRVNVVLPFKQNQALIFGDTKNNYNKEDSIILYDDNTKIFKEFGHAIRRSNPYVIPLNDNKFLIIGGRIFKSNGGQELDVREIEIFDGNNGTSKIVNKLPYQLKYDDNLDKNSFAITKLNDSYLLLTGGSHGVYPFRKDRKSTLIIDLKKNEIKRGPNLVYDIASHKMLKVSDDKILIFGNHHWIDNKKTQILKINKRRIK